MMEGIKSATVRAYLQEMPPADRDAILKSKQKIQDLELRVQKAQQTLGTKLLEEDRRDNSKAEMQAMVDLYHKSTTMPKSAFVQHYGSEYDARDVECEVRFGTNRKSGRAFSKLDYDRVIQQFLSAGFVTDHPEGMHLLRINTEYFNTKQQRQVFSSIRTEICGLDLVQQYARSNDLVQLMHKHKMQDEFGGLDPSKVKFTQKRAPELKGERMKPVEFSDFNFRISYQLEKNWTPKESDAVQKTLDNWTQCKKTFRYLNRVRLFHPRHPVFLDVSIVKSSATGFNKTTKQRIPIPEFTVQDAKVFDNAETYEIELELDNARMKEFPTSASVLASVRHCIRLVLSGIQGSMFPIGFAERNQVLHDYLCLLYGEDVAKEERRITSHHFIGPHPMTLQLENLASSSSSSPTAPSILESYSVTDKADGERKMLFVSPKTGKVYLLDTTMNVTYTGRKVGNEKQWNSLLDGEHIKHTRHGTAINKYKAFDLYYWSGKSTRELAFYEPMNLEQEKADRYESRLRLPLLQKWVREARIIHASTTEQDPGATTSVTKATDFTVEVKTFLTTYDKDIFEACREIWEAIQHPAYEYHTDGLIFTPTHPGVGSDQVGHAGPLHKNTWKLALKWKPPRFNTVDFLVRIKHTSTVSNDVHVEYVAGRDLTRPHSVERFKTLTLCCGFNPRDHGYLNPQKLLLEDEMPTLQQQQQESDYLPCAFEPSDPPDPLAHVCEWLTVDQGNGEYVLITEEGEYFDEDMIVEFRYNRLEENPRRRWIPLRVRYDKTNELRMGFKNYGNAFHVAESNWRSIWYEVTDAMITTGQHIPMVVQDDVAHTKYYNRVKGSTDTLGLRQFHNHYVKRRMIQGVAHAGDQLLDLGVGKAGDLRKWIDAKLAFVWGVDLSHDNIENRKDGACARYVGLWKTLGDSMPKAIFLQGNVELNLRKGDAFSSVKDKAIAKALFGQGPKDKTELGLGVYNQYGAAERGFHVTSCQFAIHYFFKDEETLQSFLCNVAECTREQGYFLCTSFDGNLIFDKLRRLANGSSLTKTPAPVFDIIKRYSQTDFVDDETSLGYAIDVYQDSINTWNREYLVNFVFFKRMMENYGFVLIDAPEAQSMGFVSGSGLFQELHEQMVEKSSEDLTLAKDLYRSIHMTALEKEISFLNRYCIFKKVRTVDLPHHNEKKTKAAADEPNDEPNTSQAAKKNKKNKFRAVSSGGLRVELKTV